MIEGNQLLTSTNFETKESYLIRLNTSDSRGLDLQKNSDYANDGNNSNIIESEFGKGKLKGTDKADQFTFDQFESFNSKAMDKIIDLTLLKVTRLAYLERHSLHLFKR